MAEKPDVLHADRVFCPTAGHPVPVRLEAPPGDGSRDASHEARLVCLGFEPGVCRGRCGLTGIPAKVVEARADPQASSDAPTTKGPPSRTALRAFDA